MGKVYWLKNTLIERAVSRALLIDLKLQCKHESSTRAREFLPEASLVGARSLPSAFQLLIHGTLPLSELQFADQKK